MGKHHEGVPVEQIFGRLEAYLDAFYENFGFVTDRMARREAAIMRGKETLAERSENIVRTRAIQSGKMIGRIM